MNTDITYIHSDKVNLLRIAIVRKAKEYIGTPFVHGGCGPSGVDCIGLLRAVAYDLDLSQFQIAGYSKEPDAHTIFKLIRECDDIIEINKSDWLPGDFALLKMPIHPCHFAFLSFDNCMIHAMTRNGKVVENRIDKYYQSKIVKIFRFKKLIACA